MARAHADVRQRLAVDIDEMRELLSADGAVLVAVDKSEDFTHNLVSSFLRHVRVRLVKQSVRPQDLLRLPPAISIIVVEDEEGGCVEVGRVVLLYGLRSASA
jgi:hypothetical protein